MQKSDIFEKRDTLQSLLDMHMEIAGAQTEISKRGHTLYNLLPTDTDVCCEESCVS